MNPTAKALHSVDWDFSNAPTNSGIHAIHPYPARFIPQIPRQLIDLFHPGDGSPILDPFCGSGTTLVEARDRGLEAWGIDLNPLACLIARVKTTPLPCSLGAIAKQIISQAREQISKNSVSVPEIPHLDHWFKPDIQINIAALLQEVNTIESMTIREALQVALSSLIVRVSNQESDTRYAAIEKDIAAEDVFKRFEKHAATLSQAVSSFSANRCQPFRKITVLNRDVLEVTPDELPSDIGLVVTSPPYPNAYEYWLYHKYRMYWLGMNPLEVRQREIGARPHYFRKNDYQDEKDFERQMGACFQLLSRAMKPKAKACFLVGRSVIRGRIIDNAALLQRAAAPHGFAVEGIVERHILSNRKAFNLAHGKINQEHLMVFALDSKP